MEIKTEQELTNIMKINDEEYVNRKSLFKICWEMSADSELMDSLFDKGDLIHYGFENGLSQDEMLESDWFKSYDFDEEDDFDEE